MISPWWVLCILHKHRRKIKIPHKFTCAKLRKILESSSHRIKRINNINHHGDKYRSVCKRWLTLCSAWMPFAYWITARWCEHIKFQSKHSIKTANRRTSGHDAELSPQNCHVQNATGRKLCFDLFRSWQISRSMLITLSSPIPTKPISRKFSHQGNCGKSEKKILLLLKKERRKTRILLIK